MITNEQDDITENDFRSYNIKRVSSKPSLSCECTHCVGLLAIVPPLGCEAILVEIL